MSFFKILFLIIFVFCIESCQTKGQENSKKLKVGAECTEIYLPLLQNKKIAIVANPTSVIGKTHLVDSLLSLNLDIVKIFALEHGFRGNADAGEHINSHQDKKTNLPIISLFGKSKKPKAKDLEDVDIVIFDIQDVGVRFYTYTSSMHYIMEACAENNKTLYIFDRPNPNGFYVDGNILDLKHQSFVGMHPVPIVHGLTIAEYAKMINGEKWLKDSIQCDLKIIPCKNYTHEYLYELPIKPSPNLPNMTAIYLYPSLCLLEGTPISIGRGTDFPFQVFGDPSFENQNFSFTPRSIKGASKNPKHKNKKCFGMDLRNSKNTILRKKQINLEYLIFSYKNFKKKASFFKNFFLNLSGEKKLKTQIQEGLDANEIRLSWQENLKKFKKKRKKYLLYPDF